MAKRQAHLNPFKLLMASLSILMEFKSGAAVLHAMRNCSATSLNTFVKQFGTKRGSLERNDHLIQPHAESQ